jgi:ADP-ribose pyrophosphatase YjhB (NUDIX family)
MKQVKCVDVIARYMCGFVIVQRLTHPHGLALPGGKVERGELPEHAAVREFYEETGLALVIEKKLSVYDRPHRDPRGSYVSTAFLGRAYGAVTHESEKTYVRILSRTEIVERRADFIIDHYQMIIDALCL